MEESAFAPNVIKKQNFTVFRHSGLMFVNLADIIYTPVLVHPSKDQGQDFSCGSMLSIYFRPADMEFQQKNFSDS